MKILKIEKKNMNGEVATRPFFGPRLDLDYASLKLLYILPFMYIRRCFGQKMLWEREDAR